MFIAICYACIAPMVLFFAGVGLWLFWFAYRYNILFVYDLNIDTKGLVYPRALQQLFVGLYIAEICLIGLFGIKSGNNGAVGPLILMILLLVFTALYNVALNSALTPLLNYLPKSLEAEERSLLEIENGVASDGQSPDGEPSTEKVVAATTAVSSKTLPPAPHKKPSIITKFLRPDLYTDYATMRRLVPRDFANIEYEPEVERDAYYPPAVRTKPMLLWIPRDPAGVSAQEVADTSKVIPITDEGCHLDEKNNMVWDEEGALMAPIYEPKIYY